MLVKEGPSDEMPVNLTSNRTVPRQLAFKMAVEVIAILGDHDESVVEDCLRIELGLDP